MSEASSVRYLPTRRELRGRLVHCRLGRPRSGPDIEVPGIWVGRLVLENLDDNGAPAGLERNAYQVVTAEDGTRRLAVSTPLDAYPQP
jgi:hypothetical protein